MIEKLTYLKKFRNFKPGTEFTFKPGVNLLVGDQGVGKSSILKTIHQYSLPEKSLDRTLFRHKEKNTAQITISPEAKEFGIEVLYFDFENDNLRTLSYFKDGLTQFQIQSKFSSHGQANLAMLKSLFTSAMKRVCVCLMDEPDMALCIKSCYCIAKKLGELEQLGHQIIVAVHNPIIIQSFKEVYDIGNNQRLDSKDFIKQQYEEALKIMGKL